MKVHGLWKGTICNTGGRNVLTHSFHRSPLKVAKPFTGEKGELLLYVMDTSPGLFNGDVQEIECTLEKGANLFLTNQSSCKLYPAHTTGISRQIQRFFVQDGAVLEYFPEPLVPLKGADYQGETIVNMRSGGQAILGEVITPGRAGRGELFEYIKMASQFSVYWERKLTVWDSLLLEPGRWKGMTGIMEDYTHIGSLWVLSEQITQDHVKMMTEYIEAYGNSPFYAGVSLLQKNGLVIRAAGHSAWSLQRFIHGCWDLIRRELFGKRAFQARK